LLAYDPLKVSLVRHAFDRFRWPIANSSSGSVCVVGDLGVGNPQKVVSAVRQCVTHPVGWRDAANPATETCEDDDKAAVAAASLEPTDA